VGGDQGTFIPRIFRLDGQNTLTTFDSRENSGFGVLSELDTQR